MYSMGEGLGRHKHDQGIALALIIDEGDWGQERIGNGGGYLGGEYWRRGEVQGEGEGEVTRDLLHVRRDICCYWTSRTRRVVGGRRLCENRNQCIRTCERALRVGSMCTLAVQRTPDPVCSLRIFPYRRNPPKRFRPTDQPRANKTHMRPRLPLGS